MVDQLFPNKAREKGGWRDRMTEPSTDVAPFLASADSTWRFMHRSFAQSVPPSSAHLSLTDKLDRGTLDSAEAKQLIHPDLLSTLTQKRARLLSSFPPSTTLSWSSYPESASSGEDRPAGEIVAATRREVDLDRPVGQVVVRFRSWQKLEARVGDEVVKGGTDDDLKLIMEARLPPHSPSLFRGTLADGGEEVLGVSEAGLDESRPGLGLADLQAGLRGPQTGLARRLKRPLPPSWPRDCAFALLVVARQDRSSLGRRRGATRRACFWREEDLLPTSLSTLRLAGALCAWSVSFSTHPNLGWWWSRRGRSYGGRGRLLTRTLFIGPQALLPSSLSSLCSLLTSSTRCDSSSPHCWPSWPRRPSRLRSRPTTILRPRSSPSLPSPPLTSLRSNES